MASDGDEEHDWIKHVMDGGTVPHVEYDSGTSNGWGTPPGDKFMVRGPEYLSTKVKIPAGEYLLDPLGFDFIKGSVKVADVLNDQNHRVRKALDKEIARGNQPFIWAINLQLPTKENHSVISYYVSQKPVPDGSLMDQFLKGDDDFRNHRFKMIVNIVKGPWLVKTAVGEQAICILGRALPIKYTLEENFLEIDVDIGASIVANAVVHLAFGYVRNLIVDMAFLIESQTEAEMPERLLGGIRYLELSPASADVYEKPSEEHPQNRSSFLPSRLWRTVGEGISHLIHHDSPTSSPRFSNGNASSPRFSNGNVSSPKFSNGNVSSPRFSHANASSPRFSNGNLPGDDETAKSPTDETAKSPTENH